ncbi:Ubiquitin-conjugating enzyme E2 Q2 [Orchesella cincta]|uniref:Ubiquitin-conjugating enzyme E2 Q2 n=1 Tax=Orchesella cincta TaxID=48709 RepID=A0A1D2M1P3_ORCCI|nr:Ubiquitin-conjugating enzyme E2 Q2 [Orchesella cincta]
MFNEIRAVEAVFPKTHERFQVVSTTLDELVCSFICKNGKKHEVTANITQSYPDDPPIWFADTEDSSITEAVLTLSSTSGMDNHVINQVGMLVRALYNTQDLPEPTPELEKLRKMSPAVAATPKSPGWRPSASGADAAEMEIDYGFFKEEDYWEEDDIDLDFDKSPDKDKEKEGLDAEHLKMLDRIQARRRDEFSERAGGSGSIQASERLMKELRDVFRSDTFKNEVYTVDLVDDNLYQWKIKLKGVDKDSQLYADLLTLKAKEGKDFIELDMHFKENFPFEPPFVRVVHPVINGGYVMSGGSICMELLTKNGWSSAYAVESVIMQIAATLVKGKARIYFGENRQYTLARAQQSHKAVTQIHEASGWHTPPKSDG